MYLFILKMETCYAVYDVGTDLISSGEEQQTQRGAEDRIHSKNDS